MKSHLLNDHEVKLAIMSDDQLVLKLKHDHYILDYSLLMDIILDLSKAAAVMEQQQKNELSDSSELAEFELPACSCEHVVH